MIYLKEKPGNEYFQAHFQGLSLFLVNEQKQCLSNSETNIQYFDRRCVSLSGVISCASETSLFQFTYSLKKRCLLLER